MKIRLELSSYSEDCHYFKEGKLYFECKLPNSVYKRVPKGPYKNLINQYSTNLILINKGRSLDDIIKHMCDINREYLNNSVDIDTLTSIVSANYNNPDLQPFHTRTKFFWVNPTIENKYGAYNSKRIELLEDKLEKVLTYIKESDYYVSILDLKGMLPRKTIDNNKKLIDSLNEGKTKKPHKEHKPSSKSIEVREIIITHKNNGLTPKQISDLEGIGLSKVKNHYYK